MVQNGPNFLYGFANVKFQKDPFFGTPFMSTCNGPVQSFIRELSKTTSRILSVKGGGHRALDGGQIGKFRYMFSFGIDQSFMISYPTFDD